MSEEIRLTDLSRVNLGPGDVLIARLPHPISMAVREQVLGLLGEAFPENKIVILWGDVELAVVAAEAA